MLKAAEETVENLPENPKPKINLFVYIFRSNYYNSGRYSCDNCFIN